MPLDLRPEADLHLVLEPPAGFLHLWSPGIGMVTHTLPLVAHPGPFPFRRRPAPGAAPARRGTRTRQGGVSFTGADG